MTHTKHNYTIGIDLGDKAHETCTLNAKGEIIERSTLLNNHAELIRFSSANKAATLIMEAGCHSPWISRLLSELGSKKGPFVYDHYRRMKLRGSWEQINDLLNYASREKKRSSSPSYLIVDSQSVKTNYRTLTFILIG